jgi:two-component system nitrogen regulation sensor histidine kinase NtrY
MPTASLATPSRPFEEMDAQRTEAIVAQFKKEFGQRGDDVVKLVQNIADANITLMMAIDLARPKADQSLYAHDTIGAVHDQLLDFVEIVGWDGTVISSAQYPARVGQKDD